MKYLIAGLVLMFGMATPALSGQQQQPKPANWSLLSAQQQEIWARLAPKEWFDMTPAEQSQWKEIFSVGSAVDSVDPNPAPRAAGEPSLAEAQRVSNNATPGEISTALGVPAEVIVDTTRTTWRYAQRDILFVNGRTVVQSDQRDNTGTVDSGSTTYQTKYPQLHGMAIYSWSKRDAETALPWAERCLSVKPGDKDCTAIKIGARQMIVARLRQRLQAMPQIDLYGRRALLAQAATIDPADKSLATDTDAITIELHHLDELVHTYVTSLHSSAFSPLPNELAQYTDTVPEMMVAAAETALHSAIARAEDQLVRNNPTAAHATLTSFAANREAKPILVRIHDVTRSNLNAELNQARTAGSVPALEQFAVRLDRFKGPLSDDEVARLHAEVRTTTVDLLNARTSTFQLSDPASARVFAVGLRNSAPTLAKALERPLVNVTFDVDRAGISCSELMIDDIAKPQLSYPFFVGNPADIAFVMQSVRCSVKTTQGTPQPVSSNYTATYQQDQNPQYMQLQSALQQARAAYNQLIQNRALNPPVGPFAAALYGMAEGRALGRVNDLQRQLSDTAPFTSRPVELAYTAYKTKATRVATVTVSLSANDRQSGFGDSLEVSASADSTAEGIQGANEHDSQHLENQQASPLAPSELVTTAPSSYHSPSRSTRRRRSSGTICADLYAKLAFVGWGEMALLPLVLATVNVDELGRATTQRLRLPPAISRPAAPSSRHSPRPGQRRLRAARRPTA
jgi:hypothetical protein